MLLRYVNSCLLSLGLMTCGTAKTLHADEGMWLFDDLPTEYLKEKYDFEPTDAWAEHIMLASVRFSSGGSASFVSSNGLVITNHHVAADTLYKLSTPTDNYHEDGYLATTHEEELKAPDLELNQLVSIEDVTERVETAVTDQMETTEAFEARRAVMAEIEKESLEATGLRSDVITLYGGAKYHLYRYKKYTDVRLVFAPESSIAFFGGDMDNFEYPRYCLDVAIFRVYEDGKPAEVEHFLQWSDHGADEDELVFVSGNPGRTQRLYTTAALKYLRDEHIPYLLNYFRRLEILLQQYSNESPERERRASDDLMGVQNARKAYMGMLQGLQTPSFIEEKQQAETETLAKLRSSDQLRPYIQAFETIAEVQQQKKEVLDYSIPLNSRYYEIAHDLVLMASEDEKPNAERLPEFRESGRESLEHELFSPAPIYEDLEIAKLTDAISFLVEQRDGDDPLVNEVLRGKSPRQRAVELVSGTQLNNVDYRRELAEGGSEAIRASDDPMIELARTLEAEYRRQRRILDELEEIERQAYADIDDAKLALEGTTGYPDATFTLRLAFGTVKGYELDGEQVPPWTTMGGAFRHQEFHEAREPWKLPESWRIHKEEIEPTTPLNFVSTVDIIGGNSGSPVINRAGEFVGIIFDSNLQGLTASYFYTDEIARAISVHSSAIREALKSIYGAPQLAEQLGK